MRFACVVSALSLLPTSTAFAPAPSTRTQTSLNLNFSFEEIFKDRAEELFEKSTLAIRDRLTKLDIASQCKDVELPTVEESEANQNAIQYAPFKYLPTQEQTGVEEHITRIAATLSDQLYQIPKGRMDDISLSTKDHEVDVVIRDIKSTFQPTNPPFAGVVCGDTMIIGWRGSDTPTDLLNDLSWSPCRNLVLGKHSKNIKFQGAMTSLALNDLVNWQDEIISECKKRGIKELVTTGHSLGAGLAQIAHTVLRAQIQDENSPWSELDGVNVRSVGFSGPMVTQILRDNMSDETKKFLQEVTDNSCVVIFHNDMVPRSYGFVNYMIDCLEDVGGNLGQFVMGGKKFPFLVTKRVIDKFASVLIDSAADGEGFQKLCVIWSNYVHVGCISAYPSATKRPQTLHDYGFNYKGPQQKNALRSQSYQKSGWRTNAVQDLLENHMHVIKPGCVGYPIDELI